MEEVTFHTQDNGSFNMKMPSKRFVWTAFFMSFNGELSFPDLG